STLSDFSFRAILRGLKSGTESPEIQSDSLFGLQKAQSPKPVLANSQQSSAGRGGKTPTSQTGAACVPSGQFSTASTGLMTAHCSLFEWRDPAPPRSLRSARPPQLAPLRSRWRLRLLLPCAVPVLLQSCDLLLECA